MCTRLAQTECPWPLPSTIPAYCKIANKPIQTTTIAAPSPKKKKN